MADDKQKLIDIYQELINELQYAYKQTNLPYWGRRLDEVRARFAELTKN